jgi:LPXTG-motif cell wall-anchored protein
VKTSLTPSTNELRFVKVGDKVQEQGSANLNWTASNADSVRIDPIGPVNGNSGSQEVKASPQTTAIGPVEETQDYKITATNVCGGSDTSTASLRVTGSIEGEPVAQVEPPPQLPATASPLPLLGLLGIISLGVGGLLRRYRHR